MASWSLPGKVILITGAAGGIGAATAIELSRRGAQCVLADLDPGGLAQTASAVGGGPLTVELDVTDRDACRRAAEEAIERHGGLDSVWANAGIASFGPVLRTDPEAWERTIEVNLVGAYNTVRAALPAVVERRGYVAVTASVASFAQAPGLSAYASTKAGVEAFCNSLRFEVAHLGVDVASIHPAWIATAMVEDADAQMDAFATLRAALGYPLNKTFPVERAARDIARGFERRSRRICTPPFVRALHVMRAALTTRLAEREMLRAAPDVDRSFAEEVAREGAERASASNRVREQVPGAPR